MDRKPLDTTRGRFRARLPLYAVVSLLFSPLNGYAQVTGTAPAAPTVALTKKAGDTVTVYWIAPSTYSDGSALGTAPSITYTVYSAAPGAAWKPAGVTAAGVLTWTSPPLLKGSTCYAVTDSVSALESVASAAVCIGVGVAANPPGAVGVK